MEGRTSSNTHLRGLNASKHFKTWEIKKMTTVEEIIERNTKKIEAFIDGDGESVTIGGIVIIRVDCTSWKYRIYIGTLTMYADDIEIRGCVAYFTKKGDLVACMTLMEE